MTRSSNPAEPTTTASRSEDASSGLRRVLRVTRYDRVAALLVALLIIIGIVVSMMFVVWVSDRVWVKQAAIAAQLIEPLSGGGNALGSARDLVEPGEEDIDELLEPQLEETLDAVTDLVSDQLATLDALGGDASLTSSGGGAGDSRLPGEGGDSEVVPRWQRWQILYAVGNQQAYAKQLDYFGIELGAAGGSDEIDYAFRFAKQPISRRTGQPDDEQRMYMTWRYGRLKQADLALLKTAGIRTDNRIIMQFLPGAVEARLAAVEQAYIESENRNTKDVLKTVFEVVGSGDEYDFAVKSQEIR